MTGRWCCVKLLRRGEESCGEGLLKGDLSISVFTLGEMPVGPGGGVGGVRGRAPHGDGCYGGAACANLVCLQQLHAAALCTCAPLRACCAKICAGVRRCVCIWAPVCASGCAAARVCVHDLRVPERAAYVHQHAAVHVSVHECVRARASWVLTPPPPAPWAPTEPRCGAGRGGSLLAS